jgi:hypothetical protein
MRNLDDFNKFVDSLPDLSIYKGIGGECYVFDTSHSIKEEVLLDTGEIVRGDARVMWGDDVKVFKRALKIALSFDAKYLGKGVVHKL